MAKPVAARVPVPETQTGPARSIVTLTMLVLTAALLLPFINKPLTIDDPLFVWSAKQIHCRPLDPYGFTVNWAVLPRPMALKMQNPPLTSYWLALAGLVTWNETWLHLWMLVWPVLLLWGVMQLARRMGTHPGWTALLTLVTLVFMVSATNLMCDVMMTALFVWSVNLWLAALDRPRWWLFLLAAFLAGLASLTKYFGISVVPLLVVYTLIRDPRAARNLPWLLLPLLMLLGWNQWHARLYGVSAWSSVAMLMKSRGVNHLDFGRWYAALSFLGGCILWPLAVGLWKARTPGRLLILSGLVLGPLGFWWEITHAKNLVDGPAPVTWLLSALFFAAGLAAIYIMSRFLYERPRQHDAWLLFLWILGTLVFTVFVNWTVSGRNFLPLVPPLAIVGALLVRPGPAGPGPKWLGVTVALAGVFALVGAWADFSWAHQVKSQALRITRTFTPHGKVYFQGHWGWQYYMELQGARACDFTGTYMRPNDFLVLPQNLAGVDFRVVKGWPRVETVPLRVPGGLYLTCQALAGFYSNAFGFVPFAVVITCPDVYVVYRPPG